MLRKIVQSPAVLLPLLAIAVLLPLAGCERGSLSNVGLSNDPVPLGQEGRWDSWRVGVLGPIGEAAQPLRRRRPSAPP